MNSCCSKCCCACKRAAPSALSNIEGITLKIDAQSNPLCLLPAISFIITQRGANCKKEEIEIPFSLSLVGFGGLAGGFDANPLAPFATLFNALAQAVPMSADNV